jgi:hypothetical protein
LIVIPDLNRPGYEHGRHWYAEIHEEKMRRAQAISLTCRGQPTMDCRYLWLAKALGINHETFPHVTKFLKPTLSPLVDYTPPAGLDEDDKIDSLSIVILQACGLPVPVGHDARVEKAESPTLLKDEAAPPANETATFVVQLDDQLNDQARVRESSRVEVRTKRLHQQDGFGPGASQPRGDVPGNIFVSTDSFVPALD